MSATMRGRPRSVLLPPWLDGLGPENDIVISTRIRLARNLKRHPFPSNASPGERSRVFKTVSRSLLYCPGRGTFSTVNFSALPPVDQRYLVERRVASPDLLGVDGDRGVAYHDTSGIAVMINEEDHLRLQCIVSWCRPVESWHALDGLDDELGRSLEFAFDNRRGFLTCCPTNSGTGLRVSFLVHLPALVLTKALDPVLQGATLLGIAVRGFFGEHSEVVGGFFQLSNQATMGAREQEFIANAEKTVREIVACEKRARERLCREARVELSDKIYRAYGILAYARTLSLPEFLNCASALRLGIDLGLFTEFSTRELNAATLAVMPAHLQKFAKRELDGNALSVLRAERVREVLCKKHGAPRKRTPATK
jgi:protein arginine kinase